MLMNNYIRVSIANYIDMVLPFEDCVLLHNAYGDQAVIYKMDELDSFARLNGWGTNKLLELVIDSVNSELFFTTDEYFIFSEDNEFISFTEKELPSAIDSGGIADAVIRQVEDYKRKFGSVNDLNFIGITGPFVDFLKTLPWDDMDKEIER